jgi:uncharacterized protein (DUF1501 family)
MNVTRRRFLQGMSAASVAATLPTWVHAQTGAQDYKALVAVFLFGGNDGFNMFPPYDGDQQRSYAAARGQLAWPPSVLAPILPPSAGGAQFGVLRNDLAELKTLWDKGKLAVVCNVGTLLEPLTQSDYRAFRKDIPSQLFDHAAQQMQWQTAISNGPSRTGWGGRMADNRPAFGGVLPPVISLFGTRVFINGAGSAPLVLPANRAFRPYAGWTTIGSAQLTTIEGMRDLMQIDRENVLVDAGADQAARALGLSDIVNPIITTPNPSIDGPFSGMITTSGQPSLGDQLQRVVRIIAARGETGARRQIFFCGLQDFDHHSNLLFRQTTKFRQLAPPMLAFYEATERLGVQDQVTMFVMTDFGRTLKANSNNGTDHAWGNQLWVIGGAVRGGDFYGVTPVLALNGPDDEDRQGRFIPTISVEQYAATLATWFGVPGVDLPYIFPHIDRFSTANLGFL